MSKAFPSILGLIPARAGSQGVPNKNMKLLGGTPLIRYTLEAASDARLLRHIIVSTDSTDIAGYANRFDQVAPLLRPADLATDYTPMIDVLNHALDMAEPKLGPFDYVVLLQPTCPFRAKGLIDSAIQHLLHEKGDSLVSVRKIPHRFHPWWAFTGAGERLEKAVGDAHYASVTRRQDLPDAYYRDGELYITSTALIRNGQITGGHIVPWHNANPGHINIDTPADWARAEKLLFQWQNPTSLLFSC